MMEIQSESRKRQQMIIPSVSPIINVISHSKSPTSHPHSNENQNRITQQWQHNHQPSHITSYFTDFNPLIPFKCPFYPSYLIIETLTNLTIPTSSSHRPSHFNNKYPHSQHLSPIHSPHPSQSLQHVITFNSLPTNVSKQTTHTIWETNYSRLFRMQSLIGLLRKSTIIPVSLHRLVMNRMIVVKYGVGEQEYLSFACLNSPSTNQDRRDTPDCRRISASVEKNARISIRRIRSLSTK